MNGILEDNSARANAIIILIRRLMKNLTWRQRIKNKVLSLGYAYDQENQET
ncbi:MAG: hypothetical protein ACLS5K_04690 [Streptococcus salivarius]